MSENHTMNSFLRSIGACDEAIEWVGDRPLQQAWNDCERGDWMLWLLRRMADRDGWPSLKLVVGLCCDCAELVREHWRGDAPRKAIETTRAWIRGEASIEDVAASARDCCTCAAAACAAADAASSASAAASSAYAAYAYAADDATLRSCAEIVRKSVPTLPEKGGAE